MTDASPDLSLAERIDSICDLFEQEFRAGKKPRIESCLAAAQESDRARLLQSVLALEVELRQRQGEKPQLEEYLSRFPGHSELVGQAFAEARSILSSVKVSTAETSMHPVAGPSSATAKQPLQNLGRFQIRSVLGEGAFGTVYKAHDPQLDRDVAIKVPRFGAQQTSEDRERFLREARAAGGLHHAYICPVHEVGTIDGRDYIVMAFIDGKPLSKVMQTQATLSDKQIVSVIRKIALALQDAHDNGIVHRDLKPANIMINRKGEPVIMDFGLARRSNSGDAQISHSGQIMGTPAYMSPEQARGDSKAVGPQADIYSLGVILYELLCGRRPYEGTITEVIGQILHVDAEPPSKHRSGVDARLEEICLRAIAKKPEDRFASMKELAAALADFTKTTSTVQPSAAATETNPTKDDTSQTKRFAKLIDAVSSDLEEKVERAARLAVRSSRDSQKVHVPWWTYLVGSGLIGMIVLLGIFFVIRKDTVTVVVNIPIENIKDPALSFFLDDKPIAAEAFAKPIELKPGEHELIVNRDGKEFKRFLFNVGKADNQPVVVQDVTPKESGPFPAIAPFTAEQAKKYQEDWANHLGVPVQFTNKLGMKFRLIPPGEYRRGSSDDDIAALIQLDPSITKENFASEVPQHTVKITSPFYLSVYEVTVGQFRKFTVDSKYRTHGEKYVAENPGRANEPLTWQKTPWSQTEAHPVVNVTWNDSQAFCRWLSQYEQAQYRLPTEAEWEYACRAGTTSLWSDDNHVESLVQMANVADSTLQPNWKSKMPTLNFVNASDGETDPVQVGRYRANQFGLHDMIGNVWEWCADWYADSQYAQFENEPAVDPRGPEQGTFKVRRGGAWITGVRYARAAARLADDPLTTVVFNYGFRVAASIEAGKLDDERLNDLARWQGRWRCVAENSQGRDLNANELAARNQTMRIEGTRRFVERTINAKVSPYSGTFRINPQTSPREFDFDFDGASAAGGQRGVYEFVGTKLRLIYRSSNTEKPTRAQWNDKGQPDVFWFEFERQDDGFVSLFNGKDLTGWKTHPSLPGGWTVENRLLTGRTTGLAYLFSERGDYKDFHIRAECRTNRFGNGGIFFRSPFSLDGKEPMGQGPPMGYEAQVIHEYPKDWANLTGSLLVVPSTQPLHKERRKLVENDEWFTIEVLAQGTQLTVKINGDVIAQSVDSTYTEGHIVLQATKDEATKAANADTVIQFRKIEIKELGKQLQQATQVNEKSDDGTADDRATAKYLYSVGCGLGLVNHPETFHQQFQSLPSGEIQIYWITIYDHDDIPIRAFELAGKLKNLSVFTSHRSRLPKRALDQLASCPKLNAIDVAGCDADDADLTMVLANPALTSVAINGNPIGQATFDQLARNKKLQRLNLNNTGLTNDRLKQLCEALDLVELHIVDNPLTLASLKTLEAEKTLKSMYCEAAGEITVAALKQFQLTRQDCKVFFDANENPGGNK